MASLKLVCLALVVGLVVAAPLAESGITCDQVASGVAPCIRYLRDGGDLPPACCSGIRSLNSSAGTTPDRQAICRCLQAANIRGLKHTRVSSLPGKCKVNIPFKFSHSTDCSRVR